MPPLETYKPWNTHVIILTKLRVNALLLPFVLLSVATALGDDSRTKQASAQRTAPIIRDGERMLFVGNSYTANEGGVYSYLAKALSVAKGPSIRADKRIYYGKPLAAMFTEDVQTAIRSDDFDSVVITSGDLPTMKKFDELIRKQGKRRSCLSHGKANIPATVPRWNLTPLLRSGRSVICGRWRRKLARQSFPPP